MSSNSFKIADNNLVKEADDYIRKNRLVELFEDLATACSEQDKTIYEIFHVLLCK